MYLKNHTTILVEITWIANVCFGKQDKFENDSTGFLQKSQIRFAEFYFLCKILLKVEWN